MVGNDRVSDVVTFVVSPPPDWLRLGVGQQVTTHPRDTPANYVQYRPIVVVCHCTQMCRDHNAAVSVHTPAPLDCVVWSDCMGVTGVRVHSRLVVLFGTTNWTGLKCVSS